jgi:hypothetical protein
MAQTGIRHADGIVPDLDTMRGTSVLVRSPERWLCGIARNCRERIYSELPKPLGGRRIALKSKQAQAKIQNENTISMTWPLATEVLNLALFRPNRVNKFYQAGLCCLRCDYQLPRMPFLRLDHASHLLISLLAKMDSQICGMLEGTPISRCRQKMPITRVGRRLGGNY